MTTPDPKQVPGTPNPNQGGLLDQTLPGRTGGATTVQIPVGGIVPQPQGTFRPPPQPHTTTGPAKTAPPLPTPKGPKKDDEPVEFLTQADLDAVEKRLRTEMEAATKKFGTFTKVAEIEQAEGNLDRKIEQAKQAATELEGKIKAAQNAKLPTATTTAPSTPAPNPSLNAEQQQQQQQKLVGMLIAAFGSDHRRSELTQALLSLLSPEIDRRAAEKVQELLQKGSIQLAAEQEKHQRELAAERRRQQEGPKSQDMRTVMLTLTRLALTNGDEEAMLTCLKWVNSQLDIYGDFVSPVEAAHRKVGELKRKAVEPKRTAYVDKMLAQEGLEPGNHVYDQRQDQLWNEHPKVLAAYQKELAEAEQEQATAQQNLQGFQEDPQVQNLLNLRTQLERAVPPPLPPNGQNGATHTAPHHPPPSGN